MTTTTWTTISETICHCDNEDCEKSHPATEQPADRFVFTATDGYTYQTWSFADFAEEVTDMAPGADEATVTDLETGETMDAAEFVKTFG